jgi:23S rRNA pseudouridine955/2504/2580 synthase
MLRHQPQSSVPLVEVGRQADAVIRPVGARGAQYNASCLKNKVLALNGSKMDESSRRRAGEHTAGQGAERGVEASAVPPATRSAVRHQSVGQEDAGVRVDKLLMRLLPGVPRTRILRLLRRGEVRLNGRRVGGEARVAAGDVLRIPPVSIEAPPSGAPPPRVSAQLVKQIEAAILHENPRILVVNKPAGVAVHGGSGVSGGVIEALRASRPDETLELVHRLDRDTSGCLIIARRRSTLRSLHALMREDTADGREGFDKRYLVLVRGKWQLGRKRIQVPLATHTRVGGERTVKVAANGKPATTEFSVVQFFGNLATLLEARLLTGRTHQIRVHATYAGHPVAGDEKYGDEAFNRQLRDFGLSRLFLHAHSISFEDPDRRVTVSVSAPLPPELRAVVDALAARAGRLRPAEGARVRAVIANGPQSARSVTPSHPSAAAPRRARSAAGRPVPSGRASRSRGRGSRRGPRT